MLNDATIGKSLTATNRVTLIGGLCVIETERLCLRIAAVLQETCRKLGIFFVFKGSGGPGDVRKVAGSAV
ncbi:MAG: hypothetical protein AAB380_04120 [Verrucomicrobiota bacterium]